VYKHASANRFYRLVWSTVNACWVAVAEGSRGRGKSARRRTAAAVLSGMLASGAALATAPPELPVGALPQGVQVVSGQAQVTTSGAAMTVNQATAQAILNWNSFNIGSQASVRFNQPSASAVALNRVVGTDPSRIYGQLSSNGKVFLINSNGVLFGAGAQVNVGGLVASTLGLSDQDFLAGQYQFAQTGKAAALRNDGSITSAAGGYVALLAPSVTNTGTISAAKGSVALAAGERIGLDLRGDGLITVQVAPGALAAAIDNKGIMRADGGQVVLTASAADALARSSVNNTGLIEARGLSSDGGTIRLVGDTVHAGNLDASSQHGKGGTIAVSGGALALDGSIDASGASGGAVTANASAAISAAGATKAIGRRGDGGAISYHAGAELIANDSSSADASGAANGGSVAVQADGGVLSSARYAARGTGGTGGRIDVSGASVRLLGSVLDASGVDQGGLVRVGGAFQGGLQRPDAPDAWRYTGRWGQAPAIASAAETFIGDGSVINVGASGARGQGGTAVVWSDAQTTMLGSIKARGAGAGGVVEVSSKDELRHVGLDKLDIGAGGRILLDPKNITIGSYPNVWTYQALLGKGFTGGKSVNQSDLEAGDSFGFSVALNAAGDRLAVGAPGDDGFGNVGSDRGAVRLYTFTDNNFSGAALKGTMGSGYTGGGNVNVSLPDYAQFGTAVALNANANVLAVGSATENGNGLVRVFTASGGNFTSPTLAQTLDPNFDGLPAVSFGTAVALNAAGDRVAIGSPNDSWGANNDGLVYLYSGTPGSIVWNNLVASPSGADYQQFGAAVAFDATGDKLAVGALGTDNFKGAVYLYTNVFSFQSPISTIKNGAVGGSNLNVTLQDNESFGSSVSLSADGSRLAVGSSAGTPFGSTVTAPGNVRIIDFGTNFSAPSVSATLGRDYTVGANADVTLNDVDNFGWATAMDASGTRLVIGAPFSSSQDGLEAGTGTVHAYKLMPPVIGNIAFGTKPTLDATVDAPLLAAALAAGTSVTLQANNDLTLATDLTVGAGAGSSLTLQAGRSVAINGNLTSGNRDVTIVANETMANGVSNASRTSGAANITVAASKTVDVGTGAVNMTITGDVLKTNATSGDITVSGTVTGNSVKLINRGSTAGSDVIIASGGTVSSAAGTVEIASAGSGAGTGSGVFTNNGTLSANRYLVYSDAPSTTLETVTGYNKHYNAPYTGTTPAYAASGSWFFYKTAPTLTVTANSQTRAYDGTTGTPALTYSVSAGYIDGDTASIFSGALGITGASKNVGGYAIDIGTLAQSLGYGITYNGATFSITKKSITASATSAGKIYDGNTSAAVSVGSAGLIGGDVVNFSGTGSYATKTAAIGKTVSVTGIALSGTDSGNYQLTGSAASTTATIAQRALTVGATGTNRVYDATTGATVTLNDDRVSGDVLSVTNSGASFQDKNVGTAKTVDITGVNVTGADAANYTFASTASTTANITARTLNPTVSAISRGYDGTDVASVNFGNDALGGDVVSLSGTSTFADKNAGTAKLVTTTGITLGGTDAGNYALATTTATDNADISTRLLSFSAGAADKTYDGNTLTTVTFVDNRISGDALTLAGTGNFIDKNVGNGKVVNVTAIGLSGTDAANYTLMATSTATNAGIAARSLTATASASNKVYDGALTATATYGDNRVAGDVLTVNGTAAFDDKNVGTGKNVTVTGLGISGTDSGNYTLAATTASTSADITARSLTATATGDNKVYDGALAATATYGDNRVAGDSLTVTGNAAFGDKNVANGKTVTVTGIALSGTDAANYALASTTASTTADISARSLTATATGNNKVYDGALAATATYGDNRVAGDSLTVTGAAAFGDKNVANGKAVTVTGMALSGTDANNYTLAATTASTSADITARSLTATATANNKVYDGALGASATYGDNRVAGDSLTVSGTAAFGDKNVANGKAVTVTGIALSGTDANNYTLASTTAAASADITARTLTATATGNNKVYDGALAASATYGDNRVAGDSLTVGGTAVFGDKNVGTGKTVTITGMGLSGTDAGNYTLASTTASTSADITARSLNVSAIGSNKVYDATQLATASLSDDRVLGDNLNLTSGSATFGDKNVGTAKTVTVTGVSLSGTDAGNYTLVSNTATGSADITARSLTATATGSNKVYDGALGATAAYGDNRIAGDSLTVTGNAAFGDKNVGTGKAIGVTGIGLSGTDAANYALTSTTASTSADISARSLTATATGNNKVYDGALAATATYGDNRVAGDSLTVTGTAAFGDKNVANGKAMTVTGMALSGTDANNYTLAATTALTSADITARSLTATATANNKVYDGALGASATYGDNRVAGDSLTVSGSAAFGDKNVANGKAVTVTGIALSGTDANNYTLASTTATASADITARTLTATVTGNNKVYDATLAATATYGDNRVAGDSLTVSGNAGFGDKNVGTGKAVSVTGIALSGTDAGNYTLASTTAATSADITARTLTATATGNNKVYDGALAATATYGDNRVAGDSLSVTGTAAFGDKNVANGKALTVTGIALSGTDAGNYTLASTTAATTADITARSLTASATANSKVYDGALGASATYGDNRVAGDSLTVSGNAAFGDKNVGTGKAVSVTGMALSGVDAGNYTLASTTAASSADITARSLAATATANSKVYDGALAATATFGDNRVAGDSLTVTGNAAFGDKNVGTGKAVSVTGIALSGTDAGNYTLAATSAASSADITARTLTASATASNKVYDATTAASATYGDNRVAGDALTVTGSAAFGDKNVGTGKTVSVTGLALSGADAGNYVLASTSASTSADIGARTLTATAAASDKVYDATLAANAVYGDDRILGDSLTVSGSAAFADKNVGNAKTVNVTGLALRGADAGNYTLASASATATASITPKALSGSIAGTTTKVYDGSNAASIAAANVAVTGFVAGEGATVGNVTGTYNSANVLAATTVSANLTGADLTVNGGTQLSNYALPATISGAGAISAKTVAITGTTASAKVYDGTTAATLASAGSLTGLVAGEALTLNAPGAVSFDTRSAGTGKGVTATGFTLGNGAGGLASNYALASDTVSLNNGVINQASLVVTADDKQRLTGTANPQFTYSVAGLVGGDSASLLAGTTGSTSAIQSSPAGTYAIRLSGAAPLNDYQVSYVDGKLKVLGGSASDKAIGSIVSTIKDIDLDTREGEQGPFTVVMQPAAGQTGDTPNVGNAAGAAAQAGEDDEEVVVLRGGSRVKVKRRGLRAPNPQ